MLLVSQTASKLTLLVNTLLHRLWPDLNFSLVQVGLPGANAGKFTVATLAKNYTFLAISVVRRADQNLTRRDMLPKWA
jgi:hypothetical protein